MLCDVCGKNQATVHLTEIINDQMTELHLCEQCAQAKSQEMEQQFGLGDLLGGLVEFGKQEAGKEGTVLKCPTCKLTYNDFKKIGRLGCGDCYNAFKKYLWPLLKKIHGSSRHVGKFPSEKGRTTKKRVDLLDLKSRLQQAIQTEAFEEAARLRDQIKEIEKNQAQETKDEQNAAE